MCVLRNEVTRRYRAKEILQMAYPEVIAEEQHMILEMEQEIKDLKELVEWWKDACTKSTQREEMLHKRLHTPEQQKDIEAIVRDMLDEADYEDDNDKMRELRKIFWTAGDTDKQIEAEGYDRSEVEPIPF